MIERIGPLLALPKDGGTLLMHPDSIASVCSHNRTDKECILYEKGSKFAHYITLPLSVVKDALHQYYLSVDAG